MAMAMYRWFTHQQHGDFPSWLFFYVSTKRFYESIWKGSCMLAYSFSMFPPCFFFHVSTKGSWKHHRKHHRNLMLSPPSHSPWCSCWSGAAMVVVGSFQEDPLSQCLTARKNRRCEHRFPGIYQKYIRSISEVYQKYIRSISSRNRIWVLMFIDFPAFLQPQMICALRKRALLDRGDTEMPICVRKYRYLACQRRMECRYYPDTFQWADP